MLGLAACPLQLLVDTAASSSALQLGSSNSHANKLSPSGRSQLVKSYGKMPLSFVANSGQMGPKVHFVSHGPGYELFLTAKGPVLSLVKNSIDKSGGAERVPASAAHSIVRMKLVGANPSRRGQGFDELPGKFNYFIGNDRRKWRTSVRSYGKVRYRNVYSGVDVVYYGNQQQLEYDFIVSARASVSRIQMALTGVNSIKIDESGNLVLSTPAGTIQQRKPVAYQDVNGERRLVSASYRVNKNKISLKVGAYDKRLPLIIDPALIYSTFLGGSDFEEGLGIAVDAQGNAYLTGATSSTNFPTAFPAQSLKDNFNDAYVVKLSADGTTLIYATYLGGNGDDIGNAIAVDPQGNAYVVGVTGSGSFPITFGAVQSMRGGSVDGFLTKLDVTGSSLVYSTFLGGENPDTALGISVTSQGEACVVGRTESTRFVIFPLIRNGNPAYRSTNGAIQWLPSAAELTASSVLTFALDPVNTDTVYAGTNRGVFKTVNGGAIWNLTGTSRTSTAPLFTNALAVDPSNTPVIYGATTSGVYKSVNGGDLYEVKNSGFAIPFINAIAIDPTNPTTLYAGALRGIYKSTNAGESWVELRNGFFFVPRVNEIVIDPTNPAIIYIGTERGIFKTTNGGTLWTDINSGALSDPFTPQITALLLDPLNPSIVYAGAGPGGSNLFKSIDGGETWSVSNTGLMIIANGLPFNPAVNTLAIDPVNSMILYAATSGGAIYKSTNGGANWNQSNSGLTNVTNANSVVVDPTNPATLYAGTNIGADAFVAKINPQGSAFEYLLNFGGTANDDASGVSLDSEGNAYIVGSTSSRDFPVVNAFQSAFGGSSDAYVAKLNALGTAFVYATYLGGSNADQGQGIAVHDGNAYIVGQTSSSDFPLANSFKSTFTLFDTDAFITKLSASGSALDFSSYLGGNGVDQASGVAVGNDGAIYIVGSTSAADFPVMAAPQPGYSGNTDGFLTKFSSAGNSLAYSTYLGGVDGDEAHGVAVDDSGNAYVTGTTSSFDFPTVRPFQSTFGFTDTFVTKIGVEADMSITKTDSRDPVMVNNPLNYTLTVNNEGPSPATGVIVTDTLPNDVIFASATPTQGSCSFNNMTLTCDLGPLPAFGGAKVVIAVTPTATGEITNQAIVSANEPDNNTSNNAATRITKVSAFPSINGYVRDGAGNGLNGVQVTLSGSQTATVQTDANGFFQFAELPQGGMYTVTPTSDVLSFDPASQTFNNLNADQTVNFVASPCTFAISPLSQSFGASGGSGSVAVTTLHDCPWTASSSADWITITSEASGTGNGTVNFSVSATNAPRAGHITIAGNNFAVYQEFNSCGEPVFSIANYNLFGSLTVARSADFNGDARPDIFAASRNSSTAWVLLNDGGGGFTTNGVGFGFEPQGFALADFNSDGRPDIALTSYNLSEVIIFLNDGTGRFGQTILHIPFNAGDSPLTLGLFATDLNLDGKFDLLIVTPGALATQVMFGNGAGAFAQSSPITDLGSNTLLAVTDVDSNGVPDLVFGGGGDNSRPLSVRLGDGFGNVGAPITSSGPEITAYLATADFNGDGNLDIAASSIVPGPDSTPQNPTFTGGISMLMGDGNGHFTSKSSITTGNVANITAADFNADGKMDVAYAKGEPKVVVVLGDGGGSLGSPLEIDTGGNINFSGNFGLASADFSGDVNTDLAATDYNLGVSVLRNTCAAAPYISGRITDSRTTGGLNDVTISLTGAHDIVTHADSGGNYFIGNLLPGANYVVTPSRDNFRFNPPSITINNLANTQQADFVGTPIVVQFTQVPFLVEESDGSVQVNVSRTGDLSGTTTVEYATSNGTASDRSDYTAAFGTLRFAPGEAFKTFDVLIADDSLVEGFESLTLTLSNVHGAIISPPFGFPPSSFLMEIRDNDSEPSAGNPIDAAQFFVRQHYSDFLSRIPDQDGLNYWTTQITSCNPLDALCIHNRRIAVSDAFFFEPEFQQTGSFVLRLYRVAYGNNQPLPNPDLGDPSAPFYPGPDFHLKFPSYEKFKQDRAQVIGGPGLAESQLALANAFVQRPEFLARYAAGLSGPEFVDALLATIRSDSGADLNSQRNTLINHFNQGGRGLVLFHLASDYWNACGASTAPCVPPNVGPAVDNRPLIDAEYNLIFVTTEYFGYLRRDGDANGLNFWLFQVNRFPLRDTNIQHAMVCSFITATEYQMRFGLAVTRTNNDCPQ